MIHVQQHGSLTSRRPSKFLHMDNHGCRRTSVFRTSDPANDPPLETGDAVTSLTTHEGVGRWQRCTSST